MSEQTANVETSEVDHKETIFELKLTKDGDKAKGHNRIVGNHSDLVNMIASVINEHQDLFDVLSDALTSVMLVRLGNKFSGGGE